MYWTPGLTYRTKGKGKRKAIKLKLIKLKLPGARTLQIDAAIQWFHATILIWIYNTVLEKPYQGFVPNAVTEPLPPSLKFISVPWQPIHKEGEEEGQTFVFPAGCSCPLCAGFVTPWHFAKRHCWMMPDGSITRGGCSSVWGCLIVLATIQKQALSSSLSHPN